MSERPHPREDPAAAALTDQRLTGYRFVIAGLVALLGFSGGLSFFSTGPITPLIIDHYGISHSAAGLLTGVVALVHVAAAIPISTLIGRVDLKLLIVLGALANSAPLLSFLAVDSYPLLLATRAAFGLGFVILFPATGPLLMQWFRPKELPLVNGVFVTVVSLGIAVSSFGMSRLSDATGWDAALSLPGGLSLLAAAAWLALGRAMTGAKEIGARSVVRRVVGVLRSRTTLLLVAADAGPFALLTVSLAWLPTFYNEVHGMSLARAGTLMGLTSLTGVITLAVASLLTMRISRRRPFLLVPGILVGFAGLSTFLLADSPAVYLAVVALGFTTWFYIPVLVTIPMELYPTDPSRVSMIFASIMTLGGVANFIAPLTVGVIADVTGSFVPGLVLFAVLAWSLGVVAFLLPETGPARSAAQ
jgi:cyanate permease